MSDENGLGNEAPEDPPLKLAVSDTGVEANSLTKRYEVLMLSHRTHFLSYSLTSSPKPAGPAFDFLLTQLIVRPVGVYPGVLPRRCDGARGSDRTPCDGSEFASIVRRRCEEYARTHVFLVRYSAAGL
jgi:hypothetical protein